MAESQMSVVLVLWKYNLVPFRSRSLAMSELSSPLASDR